jgi:IclR family acetate operon transcriptional repressor
VLANAALAELPLRRRALPVLQRLADAQRVATNLGILHEGLVLYLAHVPREQMRRVHAIAGKCAPVYATAMGKALLLGRPPASVRAITERRGLAPLTARTLTTLDALLADLAAAEARGYTVEREEQHPGAACLAAPLRTGDGIPVAAISVAIPAHELTPEREQALGQAVLEAVYEIGVAEDS